MAGCLLVGAQFIAPEGWVVAVVCGSVRACERRGVSRLEQITWPGTQAVQQLAYVVLQPDLLRQPQGDLEVPNCLGFTLQFH